MTDRIKEVLHVIRNPYGFESGDIRKAQLDACDEIERLEREIESYERIGSVQVKQLDAITEILKGNF